MSSHGSQRRNSTPSHFDVLNYAQQHASEYIKSIQGKNGSTTAIKFSVDLVHGFGLSIEEALAIMLSEWNPGCSPSWSEAELRHKLEDAERNPKTPKPRGWLIDRSHNKATRSPKRRATVKPVEAEKSPAKEEVAAANAEPKKAKPKNWLEK